MLLSIDVKYPERVSHQCRTLNLQCDSCGKEFTFKYQKSTVEQTRHFCSRKCSNTGRTINPDVSRVRSCVCKKCGEKFERKCNTNAPTPAYCSRSCSSSAMAIEHNSASYMNTPVVRAHAAESLVAWRSRPSKRRPALNPGRPKSGWKQTTETCEKMRDARSKLITAGKMNWALFGHKAGTHTSPKACRDVHYRSSWEQAVMIYLDNDERVMVWDSECIRIPYMYENNKRWYIPDFLITFVDGHRELWEVKAEQFITTEKVVLKSAAAMAYCECEGIGAYVMLTGAELKRRGILRKREC